MEANPRHTSGGSHGRPRPVPPPRGRLPRPARTSARRPPRRRRPARRLLRGADPLSPGRGAMLAIELLAPATGEPDAGLTARVAQQAREAGVITLTCGTWGNVIRLLPPLSIGDDLLREGLQTITD